MKKPRLLDLFCGAIDAQNNMCYDRPKYKGGLSCKQSPAIIVGKFLNRKGKQENSVQFHALTNLLGHQRNSALAVNAASRFNSKAEQMQIGAIVQKHVQKRALQKTRWPFMSGILDIVIKSTKSVLQKTLECGGTKRGVNALRQSAFLVGSV